MKASDELFRLIRTLTSSEKRYFKTNAKRENPTSNYLQLFDAIDAQKEYDEDKLKKKHAGKKFVKYLSAEKNYLHEQIMKQMRAFHVDRTVDNKINDLLQDEAFYRAKGLNVLRKKSIDKARDLAEEYERFHLGQEAIYREITYVIEISEKTLERPVRLLLDRLEEGQSRMNKYIALHKLRQELFVAYRSGADVKDQGVLNQIDGLKTLVEKNGEDIENSIRLSEEYHTAISEYHNSLSQHGNSFKELIALYNIFQTRPELKNEYLLRYRILLSNLAARAYTANDDKTFNLVLKELKELPVDSFNAEGETFQNVYFLEHLKYLGSGKLEKAEAMVPIIEEGLAQYKTKINKARLLSFQYNIMIMYFLMHRFTDARNWADRILEDKTEIRKNLTTVTRVLYPIIHFELGHQELVENLTRSAYRYLLRLKRLHGFERIMLKYLQGLPLSPDTSEFQVKLTALSMEMKELRNTSSEANTHGFEEIGLWVNYRMKNTDMASLMQQQS